MNPWDRLWRLAAQQDDVFITLQATSGCGIPASTFHDRARREAWPQVHRSVWASPGTVLTYRGQLRAAVLAGGPAAALTGASTLWSAKALRTVPDRVDLWLPPSLGPRPSGIVRVTRGALVEGEAVGSRDGFPSLSCVRAVTDLAASASIEELVRVIAALDRLRITTPGAISRHVERRGRFPGVPTLRAALARVEGDLAHSATEARGRRLVTEAGLRPHPAPYAVVVEGRPIAEIDIAFPRCRYGVEIDGPHHLLAEVARADRARDRLLRTHGWWIDRFTVDDVDDTPRAFLTAVSRGLELAKARTRR